MAGLNPDGLGRNRAYDDLESESLSAGSIVDSADGQAWETLREMGYEKGDSLAMQQQLIFSEFGFSNTSFDFAYNSDTRFAFIPFDMYPDSATIEARFQIEFGLSGAEAQLAATDKYGNVDKTFDGSLVQAAGNPSLHFSPFVEVAETDSSTNHNQYGIQTRSPDGASNFMRGASILWRVQL